jgi:hypothetical protein
MRWLVQGAPDAGGDDATGAEQGTLVAGASLS